MFEDRASAILSTVDAEVVKGVDEALDGYSAFTPWLDLYTRAGAGYYVAACQRVRVIDAIAIHRWTADNPLSPPPELD
jgi:hypothetical protein